MTTSSEKNDRNEIKKMLIDHVSSYGIEIIGVGSVDCFEERFPDRVSPKMFLKTAKSVIVLGMPYQPSTLWSVSQMDKLAPFYQDPEKTPATQAKKSGLSLETIYPFSHGGPACTWFVDDERRLMYFEINRTAYFTNSWLRKQGHEAFYFSINTKDPVTAKAPFEHKRAAYIAGVGSLGDNNCILNPKYGSGMVFTTIITDADIEPDEIIEDVCIHCGICRKVCPVGAIKESGVFDASVCYCCTRCVANCPVGTEKRYKNDFIIQK